MTKASLLQLAVGGEHDKFIYSGKPDISRFLTVFNAGSNYSSQPIEILMDGPPIFGGSMHFTLDHSMGDLVNSLYLRVNLPRIDPKDDIHRDSSEEFYTKWVENVGLRLIEKATFSINGTTIVEHTGEFMRAKGNIMIEPLAYVNMTNVSSVTANNTGDSCLPSQTIYVPLMFWFCESYSKSLPLVALQHAKLKVDIKFAPIDDLLVVWTNENNVGNEIKKDWCVKSSKIMNVDCIANVVFLGTNERNKLALSSIELPITQVQYTQKTLTVSAVNNSNLMCQDVVSNCSESIDLSTFKLPMSCLLWTAQWDLLNYYNDWTNFTQKSKFYLDEPNSNLVISQGMLYRAQLLFEGLPKTPQLDDTYYSLVQSYQHGGHRVPNVNMFCFGESPASSSPNGSCNFSHINEKALNVQTRGLVYDQSKHSDPLNTVTVKVYGINHNILLIQNGLGALLWTE